MCLRVPIYEIVGDESILRMGANLESGQENNVGTYLAPHSSYPGKFIRGRIHEDVYAHRDVYVI